MQADFDRYADEIKDGLTERKKLSVISAADLQRKTFEPLRESVPGLIVQGLTILASPPKYGKSWFVLDCCLSVATGGMFLGYKTKQSACLYLALEDSERRLQDRTNKLLNGATAPENFFFATSASTTDKGLLETIEDFLREHPDIGLVVIDTLQLVRGKAKRTDVYGADYDEMALLKSFADKNDLALVLVHHLRKMSDDADPFMRISGSTGIIGAADTMIVLTKDKRTAETATLTATGRDIDGMEIEVSFDSNSCKWSNLGDTEELKEQRAREEYDRNPIVLTVRKLLRDLPEWTGRANDLMKAGQYFSLPPLASSLKSLAAEIKRLEPALYVNDQILHSTKSGGTGSKVHVFRRQTPSSDEELPY